MGSEISKTYAVDETPTGTAGLSGMWKLHQGVHRKTDEAVTVWIFSPTVALNGLKDKAVKGVLLDCMRRDLKSMKEMRHPAIPEVIASRRVVLHVGRVKFLLFAFRVSVSVIGLELGLGLGLGLA